MPGLLSAVSITQVIDATLIVWRARPVRVLGSRAVCSGRFGGQSAYAWIERDRRPVCGSSVATSAWVRRAGSRSFLTRVRGRIDLASLLPGCVPRVDVNIRCHAVPLTGSMRGAAENGHDDRECLAQRRSLAIGHFGVWRAALVRRGMSGEDLDLYVQPSREPKGARDGRRSVAVTSGVVEEFRACR